MKYTTQTLHQTKPVLAPEDILFFWGHRDNQDGSVGKGCLSQWYPKAPRTRANFNHQMIVFRKPSQRPIIGLATTTI